jgi:putative heme-binding domain-containing protein
MDVTMFPIKLHSFARATLCLAISATVSHSITLSQQPAPSQDTAPDTAPPTSDSTAVASLNGSLKVVRLLWKTNPQAAATTLSKSLTVALERGQRATLPAVLAPMRELFVQASESQDDPRLGVSLAALALSNPNDEELRVALKKGVESGNAKDLDLMIRVWFSIDPDKAFDHFASMISTPQTQAALPLLMQHALKADRNRAAGIILDGWDKWPREMQIAAIEPMTAQASTMLRLVKAVEGGRLAKDLINMNQLRKWQNSGDEQLGAAIEGIWGKVRQSDDAERQKLVQEKLSLLRKKDSRGSIERGQVVFNRVCSQCHQLHGQGFEVGPAITNNGRGNLEQLVSNVLDPSLVIGAAYQAKTVLTTDGEVVSGVVVGDDERFLKLKVQGGKVLEFNKADDIEQVKASTKSLMPEGLEAQMTEQEFIDLFAYLCLAKAPDAPDNELISGTPPQLVNP